MGEVVGRFDTHSEAQAVFDAEKTRLTGLASKQLGAALFSRSPKNGSAAGVELGAVVDRVTQGWHGAPPIDAGNRPEGLSDAIKRATQAQQIPLHEIVAVWHTSSLLDITHRNNPLPARRR